jgi:hypothetical protein
VEIGSDQRPGRLARSEHQLVEERGGKGEDDGPSGAGALAEQLTKRPHEERMRPAGAAVN